MTKDKPDHYGAIPEAIDVLSSNLKELPFMDRQPTRNAIEKLQALQKAVPDGLGDAVNCYPIANNE